MRVPKRQSEELYRASQTTDNHMTADKLERLKRDLERIAADRPQVLADLQTAQAMGDLSENAAYTEAKATLRRMDNRALRLKERIRDAIIIEGGADASGNAKIGSKVTVEVHGKQKVYTIVGSQETDPSQGRVSRSSPVGAALIGHGAGDVVFVTSANGNVVEYRIQHVE